MAPRSVRLSSPERVLYPDDGITKEDLFEYYRAIAPVLVPHLRNRPFTMKRFPYGATGDVYAATDFGVLRLPAGATHWETAGSGLPTAAVYGLTLSQSGSVLYAATHGRGAWKLTLP